MTRLALVLVGTDYHPFDRLVSWMDAWSRQHPDVRVLVQRGTSKPPTTAESVEFVEYSRVQQLIAESAVVVCHGGPSTIAECRRQQVIPLVVARDPRRGEHVDEHQMLFTARLAASGIVRSAQAEADLVAMLDEALQDPSCVRAADNGAAEVAATCARFGAAVAALFPSAVRARAAVGTA